MLDMLRYLQIGVLAVLVIASIYRYQRSKSKLNAIKLKASETLVWDREKPRKLRPFVGKRSFNPSMGIKNISSTPEEWFLIEDTYQKVTGLKKELVEVNEDHTVLAYDNKATYHAVHEFYSTVVHHLCSKYPQYFSRSGDKIKNHINGELLFRDCAAIDSITLLKNLASNIEEDFFILLKDHPHDEKEEYIFRAGVSGFPSGFDPAKNYNKPISYIHGPVPQYEDRLKLSMSRFFNRLTEKDLWVRHNWTIQIGDKWFVLDSNHAYEGEEVEKLEFEDVDFSKTFLRAERQVLTRLPQSRANVMTVRTYLTPIQNVKDEGLAGDLIYAIQNLPNDLAAYKRREAWGDALIKFLSL
ncbi:Piso0_002537 [Millerozyma farinosa CBS 7064]|uniref:Piso0_002537 protein n=1 Tax=Pichia sorbitophila (strain ATCC MYA-4447 / BCRC 22081 / CBS 7064 / NBRC 10061 / NRRL Y-12695) TaxID=559304 RepID=G8YFB1_PICSO|nr:Piso0_002537 [Millerozyma farinosa CBS 7064]